MTQTVNPPAGPAPDEKPVPAGHVRLTIDGVVIDAPKGELVIRAAERIERILHDKATMPERPPEPDGAT